MNYYAKILIVMIDLDKYILTPDEMLHRIADNEKARRKNMHLTQEELARRSGVSLGSLRRFEQTGDISLESLMKIAIVLNETDNLIKLFAERDPEYKSMEDLLNAKRRKS